VIVHVLIVWGVTVVAISLALLIVRRRHLPEDEEPPDYKVVLGFVASAYGLLLGLLVVFAVGHYNDTRTKAEDEATSLVALHDAVAPYPARIRAPYRQDLLCYMNSIVEDDWPSMEDGNSIQSGPTLAWGDRLRAATQALPLDTDQERAAYGRALGFGADAGKARQQLLFFTEPRIPTALWVVIYVGVFLMVLLITLIYTDNPKGRITALGCLILLLTVVVAVLSMLDNPFGPGVRVPPNEMRQAIELVDAGHSSVDLQSCQAGPQKLAG
jgi:protein-S-isoprenylcysteine O-methyltransferase Ste14